MKFAFEGQRVYAPIRRSPSDDRSGRVRTRWLLCEVACASGDMARVTNDLHGVDRWFDVHELRMERP